MAGQGQRYARLAEAASALAVVLTLVFVGLQVRETARQTALNTESMRVAAYQDLIAQIAQFNHALLDPTVGATFDRMMVSGAQWSEFTGVDRRQARSILFMLIRHADMAYYQFEQGILSEERMTSALAPLLGDINRPMYREFWEEVKPYYVPSFREFLDRRIAESAR